MVHGIVSTPYCHAHELGSEDETYSSLQILL